jgi:dTDP-4-amino-4,6-dideoxygalactose transaminase
LRGDWLTQGPFVEEFEEELASYVGVKHAVAVANGTAALHAAVAAAGLGTGDVIATSTLSFSASAACALYVGAKPVFVDIDPATLNLDLSRVPENMDALIAVHYSGLPADLSRLPSRPRVVIEDAAQALGAMTPDGPVGNCARSDMCTFSFHPVKSITTGEGGAITTNSDELADRLRRFRNHGITRKPEVAPWYFEVEELGYNYRITDIHAALGTSQLARIEDFIARRHELATNYHQALRELPLLLPPVAPPGWRHAHHLYPIRVPDRRRVYDFLRGAGIGVQVHHVPMYVHPIYGQLDGEAAFPETAKAYAELLSLPLFPDLADEQQSTVIEELRNALDAVT